jgi:excisionase family DNA binding protein
MRGGSNRLLSTEQVAERLGVSRKTVYRHWEEWGLRARPLGRLLRFAERDVDNFVERISA